MDRVNHSKNDHNIIFLNIIVMISLVLFIQGKIITSVGRLLANSEKKYREKTYTVTGASLEPRHHRRIIFVIALHMYLNLVKGKLRYLLMVRTGLLEAEPPPARGLKLNNKSTSDL